MFSILFLLGDANLSLPPLQLLILVDVVVDLPLPATLLPTFHLLQVPLDFALDEIALLLQEMLFFQQGFVPDQRRIIVILSNLLDQEFLHSVLRAVPYLFYLGYLHVPESGSERFDDGLYLAPLGQLVDDVVGPR